MILRILVGYLIAFSLMSSEMSTRVLAQTAQAPALSPWMVALQNGQYNFDTYNKSQVQTEFVSILRARSEADYAYFNRTLTALDQAFKELLQKAVFDETNGLYTLSIKSLVSQSLGNAVDAVTLATAQGRYRANRATIQNQIDLFKSISEAFPSQQVSAEGSGVSQIPNYGNMNFSKVTAPVVEKLEEIDRMVSNLGYQVVFPAEFQAAPVRVQANSGKGLEPVIPRASLSNAELQKRIDLVNDLRKPALATIEARNASHTWLLGQVRGFVSTYGFDEKWRIRNDQDLRDRDVKWQEIVQSFFLRSYIRAVYGLPLCAIGIPYDKEILKLDVIKATATSLSRTISEPVCYQKEYQVQRTNYTNALLRADARSKKILPNILKGQIGPIQVVENLLTFVTGNRTPAQAINMMLLLMAADFYEEELLVQVGGLEKMNLRFKDRYAATDESRTKYQSIADQFDSEEAGSRTTMASGSEQAVFTRLLFQARTVELNRLAQADENEAFIKAATGLDATKAGEAARKRRGDLFGPRPTPTPEKP